MTQEKYLFTDSILVIEDPELDIHIQLPCQLPRILEPLAGQENLILEKDEAGHIATAYLVSEGKRQGACCLFYPEGQKKAEMFYDRGALHGPSIFYSETTAVLTETWYVHGKKEGKVKYFYPSQQLACMQRYKEGLLHSLQEYWYEDGTAKSTIPYEQGALHGEVRLYWEDGKPKRTLYFVKGLKHGWDRFWNEKGTLIDEGEFHDGQPVGAHRRFFEEGQKKEEFFYHTPLRYDVRQWNASGDLVREGLYAADLSYIERTFELQPRKTIVRKGYWDGQRLCWK